MFSYAAWQLDWTTIVAGLGMVVLILLAKLITRGAPPPDAVLRSRNEPDPFAAARDLDRRSYLRRRGELRDR
jgi:hypothetical protein